MAFDDYDPGSSMLLAAHPGPRRSHSEGRHTTVRSDSEKEPCLRRTYEPLQIQRMLPRTNCKQCGAATCYAFAFDLIARSEELPEDCPSSAHGEVADCTECLEGASGRRRAHQGDPDHVLDRPRGARVVETASPSATGRSTAITKGGRLAERAPVPPAMMIIDGNLSVVEWSELQAG